MATPGPSELGRGVVVLPGVPAPEPWKNITRIRVGDETLADPTVALETLHRAWFERRPVVVELAADPRALRQPQRCDRPVYELSPRFEFSRERLQFLVWANNYDARAGEPIWWHGRKAARAFSGGDVRETGPADIVLDDGTPLYVDGGPFAPPPLPRGPRVVHRWNTEAGSLSVGSDDEPTRRPRAGPAGGRRPSEGRCAGNCARRARERHAF